MDASDNVIEWSFDKIFNQLTMDGAELSSVPFDIVREKVFCHTIYQILANLTNRSVDRIDSYLTNINFVERFLFKKMGKMLYVKIVLDDFAAMVELIDAGCQIDNKCLQLIVLNNRMKTITYLVDTIGIKLDNSLLIPCSRFGHES